jgi:hypothetical protein
LGYSTSVVTLQRLYEYIKPLEFGEPYVWITDEGEAARLAYKIREALYVAKLHTEQFPELAAAADRFVIEVVSSTKVQARLSIAPTEARILSSHGDVAPQHGDSGSPTLGRIIATSGEQTAFTIIEAWKKSQPNLTPINFPSAKLNYEQLLALWNWAQTWKPKPLMIMYDEESGSLTLGPIEADVVKYSWHPHKEDMPEPEEKPKSFPIPPKRY